MRETSATSPTGISIEPEWSKNGKPKPSEQTTPAVIRTIVLVVRERTKKKEPEKKNARNNGTKRIPKKDSNPGPSAKIPAKENPKPRLPKIAKTNSTAILMRAGIFSTPLRPGFTSELRGVPCIALAS